MHPDNKNTHKNMPYLTLAE